MKYSFALIALAIFLFSPNLFANESHNHPPKLITICRKTNEKPSEEKIAGKNLVVITHGWFEKEPWPEWLAEQIAERTDDTWVCAWLDWRKQAKVLLPEDAADYAKCTGAKYLAYYIMQMPNKFEHIHLIGHSAGCWTISETARSLLKQTDADIQLTFLDAYTPMSYEVIQLTDFFVDNPARIFADHYFTKDITLKVTQCPIPYTLNIDITAADPDIPDHEFARYWYPATVMRSYDNDSKYAGKKLYSHRKNQAFGYCLSLEADPNFADNFPKVNIEGKKIKIKPQKESFFEWLFGGKK
jgi:hypothetical protein